jgi:hypothetical protein
LLVVWHCLATAFEVVRHCLATSVDVFNHCLITADAFEKVSAPFVLLGRGWKAHKKIKKYLSKRGKKL